MKNKLLILVIVETVLLICMVIFSFIQRAEVQEYRIQAIQLRVEAEAHQAIAIRNEQLCKENRGQLAIALEEAHQAKTKLEAYLAKQGSK